MWLGTVCSIEIHDELTGDHIKSIEIPAFNMCNVNNDSVWIGDIGKFSIVSIDSHEISTIEVEGTSIAVTYLQNHVWSADNRGSVRVIDINTKKVVKEISFRKKEIANCCSIATNFDTVWCMTDNGSILIFDSQLQLVKELSHVHENKIFGSNVVGHQIWSYSWNGNINIWNKRLSLLAKIPKLHADAISSVNVIKKKHPPHYRVFATSWDKSISVWKAIDFKNNNKHNKNNQKHNQNNNNNNNNNI